MSVLYLDLVGGLSGDMFVGALVDLGVPLDLLRERLHEAGLERVDIATRRERRHQIAGTRFLVTHAGGSIPDGGLPLPARHAHAHGHRPWQEIDAQLVASRLPLACRELVRRMFGALAEAESAIHDVPQERVEFHEVGAWDSMADIVCAAAGLVHLGPERVLCSPVPLGAGEVRTAHGVLPVPAPATLRLLQGFPVVQGGAAFERTTPTGAVILATAARPAPTTFHYVPERIGVGIGKAERAEFPNLVRAVWGTEGTAAGQGLAYEAIELAAANLDDSNPEWIGFAVERLFGAGALDVALVPIHMKKNRPGTQIEVLYPPALREQMLAILFTEVTTLGVRFQSWERAILPRETVIVQTAWGPIQGKLARFGDRERFTPEFEACRAVALKQGVPLQDVYRAAEAAHRAAKSG